MSTDSLKSLKHHLRKFILSPIPLAVKCQEASYGTNQPTTVRSHYHKKWDLSLQQILSINTCFIYRDGVETLLQTLGDGTRRPEAGKREAGLERRANLSGPTRAQYPIYLFV